MKIKGSMLCLIAILSFTFAKLGSGVNCWGVLYQPKMPEELRKSNTSKIIVAEVFRYIWLYIWDCRLLLILDSIFI